MTRLSPQSNDFLNGKALGEICRPPGMFCAGMRDIYARVRNRTAKRHMGAKLELLAEFQGCRIQCIMQFMENCIALLQVEIQNVCFGKSVNSSQFYGERLEFLQDLLGITRGNLYRHAQGPRRKNRNVRLREFDARQRLPEAVEKGPQRIGNIAH